MVLLMIMIKLKRTKNVRTLGYRSNVLPYVKSSRVAMDSGRLRLGCIAQDCNSVQVMEDDQNRNRFMML